MSNNLKDLVNNADSQAKMTVNPLDYPSIACDKCGCEYFEQAMVFKKIPGLLLGQGSEPQIYPIPVFVCKNCGDLMPEYKDEFSDNVDSPKPNNSIIL